MSTLHNAQALNIYYLIQFNFHAICAMCNVHVRSLAIVATMTTTRATTSTAYTAAARRYRRPQYSDTKIVGNFFISSPSPAFTIFTHFKVDFTLVNLYQISPLILFSLCSFSCCAVSCCSVIITCDYGISTIIINEDMCSRMALLLMLLPILGARIQFIFNVVNFN